ncbi:MAG: hypothetical protein ACOX05_04565 [Bacillota bacterium]|jgi:hypothetical protein
MNEKTDPKQQSFIFSQPSSPSSPDQPEAEPVLSAETTRVFSTGSASPIRRPLSQDEQAFWRETLHSLEKIGKSLQEIEILLQK